MLCFLHFLTCQFLAKPCLFCDKHKMRPKGSIYKEVAVLGLARTGLIFTGIQEGNPGRDTAGQADPIWLNRAGYSIPCAALLGSGGEGAARQELTLGSGARSSGGSGEWVCYAVCFVLCIPLICIAVVPVPFVSCSVKLPLSRPTGFCLFLSILLRTLAGGGAARWRFCCQLQPKPEQ